MIDDKNTLCVRVYGIVQGVGFRPTVSRHAMKSGVRGSVCNKGPYVEIVLQGTKEQKEQFLELLEKHPPKRAAILKIDVKIAEDNREFKDFQIIESEKTAGEIFVSPDIAVCEECKREMYDPANRRYLHPFINCTCCGPRLTILDALPYDRERTSMKEFPMCPDCATEYDSPESRRYDAQPVCCPNCGPEVYLLDREERGRDAITLARQAIADGKIIAVKGIGGFHLCCDATNPEAVALLRERKHRPMKPFAVMMRDESVVKRECEVTPELEEILTGHQKPILLLAKKKSGRTANNAAPDNPKLGVMLPYAPVQLLLFEYNDGIQVPDCLVMTSANESGAPIVRDDEGARESLSGLCDLILSHNRKIRLRADDTVMDTFEGAPYMIRRSRGYAPLPFMLSEETRESVLAIGGELKNSFCIGTGTLYYPSPYIGDLADIRTVNALTESVELFKTLLEVEPKKVVCDLHPLYHSVEVAKEMEKQVVQVQHHYAHILSCMAENDYLEKVTGVSFDGTGYGTDGTIWGGEIMQADRYGFTRMGHIAPFRQVGGDISAKEGWRIAAAMIAEHIEDVEEAEKTALALGICDSQNFRVIRTMIEKNMRCVRSTSVGRLFDAAAAILGIRTESTFEGEAATALMYQAMRYYEESGIPVIPPIDMLYKADDESIILGTNELVEYIIAERLGGSAVDYLAAVFHEALSQMVYEACLWTHWKTGIETIALSGGVFQNTLLLKRCKEKLEANAFKVLIHHMVPPNDGGIALGQAIYLGDSMGGN